MNKIRDDISAMDSEIIDFIKKFNSAWISSSWADLMGLLDEDTVFVAPDENWIGGRGECIRTIKGFVTKFETDRIDLTSYRSTKTDSTAVVNWTYDIVYRSKKDVYSEHGNEFWVLSRKNGRWTLLYRALQL